MGRIVSFGFLRMVLFLVVGGVMENKSYKKILIILFSLVLASCSSAQKILSSEDEDGKDGITRINELLDEKIGIVDKDNTEMRLLRAQLVIAMFARYGAARFEDYSHDPVNDATKLLGRVSVAQEYINAARNGEKDSPFYPVRRADIVLATLDVVTAAVRPTIRGVASTILPSSTPERLKRGKQLLENALTTKLYASAYKEGFENIALKNKSPMKSPPTAKDWDRVDNFIIDACTNLRGISKIELTCITENTDKEIAAK